MQTIELTDALIIPFPARSPAGADQARLKNALAELLQALEQQKAAVAAWRASLGNLRESVDRLGQHMGEYRANLTGLAMGVDHLGRQAQTLARITDSQISGAT